MSGIRNSKVKSVNDAQRIYRLIHNKFKRIGYSVFPQVRSSQGTNNIRIADALAISQSALRDTSFIGFEIKVSKSDFNNELAKISKADEVARFCNKWYVVAPKGVIQVDELPEKWGLIEATKTQLRTTKKALELPCIPPTREFVAAIVRKVENSETLKGEYWRGYQDGIKEERNRKVERLNSDSEELQMLRNALEVFKTNSGIDIFYWNDEEPKRIGEAVRLLKEDSVRYRIKSTEKIVSELLSHIRESIQELEANPLNPERGAGGRRRRPG